MSDKTVSGQIETQERPFLIERAMEADIPAIVEIAKSVRLDVQNPDPELGKKGFLVYVLSPERYQSRLNPYFKVAREGDRTTAFLMCYTSEFLKGLRESGEIGHEDGIMNFLDQHVQGCYIFGDQIGIDYARARKKIGTDLMKDVFERARKEGIQQFLCAILHSPVKNQASIAFCSSLSAESIGEVQNEDGLMWGIYWFDLQVNDRDK